MGGVNDCFSDAAMLRGTVRSMKRVIELPDLPGLPDILVPGLRVVMLGSNPSIRAGQTGHYYAHPGNRFYPLLHEVGLTPRLLRPEEDGLLPTFGIGLTDLHAHPSRRANDVSRETYIAGRAAVTTKLAHYQPRWLCCNGGLVYRNLTGDRTPLHYGGPQDTVVAGVPVFVVPSTSGLNCALTTERREAFRLLAAMLRDDR